MLNSALYRIKGKTPAKEKKRKTPDFESQRGCLVSVFKQQFSVFKQHFTYFNTLFHPHVFPQKFSNNNFQFLNTCTKRAKTPDLN